MGLCLCGSCPVTVTDALRSRACARVLLLAALGWLRRSERVVFTHAFTFAMANGVVAGVATKARDICESVLTHEFEL